MGTPLAALAALIILCLAAFMLNRRQTKAQPQASELLGYIQEHEEPGQIHYETLRDGFYGWWMALHPQSETPRHWWNLQFGSCALELHHQGKLVLEEGGNVVRII